MSGRRRLGRGGPEFSAILRFGLSAAAIIIAVVLWLEGFRHSPLIEPRRPANGQFAVNHLRETAPDMEEERILAESYWRRYRDVRNDAYWGEGGPMGIGGPRDHYRQHGRREGRIFQPLAEAPDLEAEKILARAYWARYPEVRHSPIWGEDSDLGILGPRDHFIHVGTALGLTWGLPASSPSAGQ
jgi:hypothetical protein